MEKRTYSNTKDMILFIFWYNYEYLETYIDYHYDYIDSILDILLVIITDADYL